MTSHEAIASVRRFKDALSHLSTGVTVVTARHAGVDWGMTCNSFTSVSLEPALVLWCLRRDSGSHAAFTQDGGYAVSVLSAGQDHLAVQFAQDDPAQRFQGVDVERLPTQRARLARAIAWFDCSLESCTPAGDHDVLVGRVLDFGFEPGEGLVYARRRFGRVLALA